MGIEGEELFLIKNGKKIDINSDKVIMLQINHVMAQNRGIIVDGIIGLLSPLIYKIYDHTGDLLYSVNTESGDYQDKISFVTLSKLNEFEVKLKHIFPTSQLYIKEPKKVDENDIIRTYTFKRGNLTT